MAKEVYFGREIIERMAKGLDKAANAVSGTIGPKGLNVFLDDELTPKIINDGATIADKIVLNDKVENAGAYVIRNVSSKQLDDVGDGTSTVALLTQSIIHECLKRPENPMELRESLKKTAGKVLAALAKKSVKVKKEDIEKVAAISCEHKELAKFIAEIIDKLGEKAVINVEDSKTFMIDYEIVDGYEAPVGFLSPHFINDKKTGKAIYADVPVLVCEKRISNQIDLKPLWDEFQQKGITQCVVVCAEIEDSILGILVMNKLMGRFNSLVVRATGELLQDIEGVTGATIVSDSTGVTFKNLTLEHLGRAKKVVCDANKILFLGRDIQAKVRAQQLDKRAENEPNMFVKKIIEQRAARLRGGIAVLKIGASTDFEREYLKLKAEDAVKAVQAALAEGVVEGGGMALWRISRELGGKTAGEQVLKKAIQSPFRKIIENAGKEYDEIEEGIREAELRLHEDNGGLDSGRRLGYDVKGDCYCDMMQAGIVDPVKVERCAIENAVSAASQFITTFALVADIKGKEN